MIRSLGVALILALALAPAACVVVGPGHRGSTVAGAPACHPSQYWDGTQCRHKGRGQGARKHDGR